MYVNSVKNHEIVNALQQQAFVPLPVGAIQPRGWLFRQLRIQADGLTGHLEEFWPDIKECGWVGGEADGWERGPYWLDGALPLAFLLDDPGLKASVCRWMEYILAHQESDGWLGPVNPKHWNRLTHRAYDPWPVFPFLKAAAQYHEATADRRVIPAMERFFSCLYRRLEDTPLLDWARFRWQDLLVSVFWLYERTGRRELLDLAERVREQGYDWLAHFADFKYPEKMRAADCKMETHVVNNAMAVKAAGVWYRYSKDPEDRAALFRMIDTLDLHHGQVTGIFSGDEHYAGRNPSQGAELCAVMEYLFSLEVLISIVGEASLAERLERIAFNALPAVFTPDMWAHQYVHQPNQVVCKVSEERVYTNNGPEANIFGLQPNFGCCTANMHQGWPKFASHLWMRLPVGASCPYGGLAAVTYAPCEIKTTLDGKRVHVLVDTEYPFNGRVNITVRTGAPITFPLLLCVPEWAVGTEVETRGKNAEEVRPGGFCRVEQEWHGNTLVTVDFPMRARLERRYNKSIAIHRGPLVFSLKIEEEWRQLRGELPHADWEVYPKSAWNYALQIDKNSLDDCLRFESSSIGDCPFSPSGAPIRARVNGRRLPEWQIERNAAAQPPESPVTSSEALEELTLIPYGSTNLRITEFPTLG